MAATWNALLEGQAAQRGDARVFTWLPDNGGAEVSLTFGELHQRARTVAAALQQVTRPGDRVLLLHPSGLDYVVGFFGCLYAGAIAVPAYPPDSNRAARTLPRIQGILRDAGATVALTSAAVVASGALDALWENAGARPLVLATDTLAPDLASNWTPPEIGPETLALLQYTSGSTSSPRGVMLTHANMVSNARLQQRAWELSPRSVGVSWLPLYHDLGVISVLMQPVFVGFHTVLMSPGQFLQQPLRWLEAIHHHRGTFAGGPNFTFDLCLRRTTPAQRSQLDLSCWTKAFNGAEPIRHATLEAFIQAFSASGFRRESMYPCYGLAEANFASGALRFPALPVVRSFDRQGLEQGEARAPKDGQDAGVKTIVGCGHVPPDHALVIVDPQTLLPCPDGRAGELWLSGDNVAQGYWGRPEESLQLFHARLAKDDGRSFLRTGDLAFVDGGEVFIAGRLKDLIIIRGVNHYPQDIELTVEGSQPAMRAGCGAAFSVEVDGTERVVVLQECDPRGTDLTQALETVRHAVLKNHDLPVHAVVLLRPGTILKTTSGKIQRRACKAAFLERSLDVLAQWDRPSEPVVAAAAPRGGSGKGFQEIQQWLVAYLSGRLNIPVERLGVKEPLAHLGLDSMEAVAMSGELSQWLGVPVATTVAYEHPTVEALARAFARDQQLRTHVATKAAAAAPVAIVGLGCRFPGAPNPAAYWRMMRDGVDAISEVPADRWDARALFDANPRARGRMSSRWGGFLDNVSHFDPLFFGISPREAEHMDPQQRLLLEVAWEAFEDAGCAPARLEGTDAGVFVGVTTEDYGHLLWQDPGRIDVHSATGMLRCIAANRLSYVFDLRGPSMTLDTACSASLVAIHEACRSLQNGECSVALAGGVNVILSPENTMSQSRLGGLAADGRCKTFDARADGIVRGEGCGLVVLKPLDRAMADGDRIYAVIRGSAVNQDGRSNGLTAPNPAAQEAVLKEAYRRAGISPGRVGYVEAHGTGTRLGDPIEVNALGAVLASERPEGRVCAVGSVKTNMGHLEAAAGIAGVIKVALSMTHEALPPNLHFSTGNPDIPFERLGLRVQTHLEPWTGPGRIAGVSGFGIGGTNAHVVLESAPETPVVETPESAQLLAVSARTRQALDLALKEHEAFLGGDGATVPLVDLCHMAGVRREHHAHRFTVVGKTAAEMRARLQAAMAQAPASGVSMGSGPGKARKVGFVFSGHGSQYVGMASSLVQEEPVFRATVEACSRALEPRTGWSVMDVLTGKTVPDLERTDVVQPLLFSIQVALAALWRAWGVQPAAMVGTSMGEVAAACAAGSISLEDAARIVASRSALLMQLRGLGAMALVGLGLEDARRLVAPHGGRLSIASNNGPLSTVVSGDVDALEQVLAQLGQQDVFARRISADGAGHCHLVDPLRDALIGQLGLVDTRPGNTPLFSSVTGDVIPGAEMDARYWGRNLREPVLFASTVDRMRAAGVDAFLEVSPHPLLVSSLVQCLDGQDALVLASLRRGEDARETLLSSLGALHVSGHPVDFSRHHPVQRLPVSMPGHPFLRDRFWLPPSAAPARSTNGSAPGHPFLMRRLELAREPGVTCFEGDISPSTHGLIAEHTLDGMPVFHSLTITDMVAAAAESLFGQGAWELGSVHFLEALMFPAGATHTVQLTLTSQEAGQAAFELHARPHGARGAAWTRHATGTIKRIQEAPETLGGNARLEVLARCREHIGGAEFRRALAAGGAELGPRFHALKQLHRCQGEVLAELELPDAAVDELADYRFHPAVLDACGQVLVAATGDALVPAVPVHISRLLLVGRPAGRLWAHARLLAGKPGHIHGDIRIFDDAGKQVAALLGVEALLHLRRVARAVVEVGGSPVAAAPRLEDALAVHGDARSRVVLEFVASQVARVLRVPAARLDTTQPLRNLGMDSLMLVEVKARVAAEWNVIIPLSRIQKGASVQSLARLVQELMAPPVAAVETAGTHEGPSNTLVQTLERDAVLDPAIRPHGSSPVLAPPRRVLLTGATGYLGAYLLAELLERTTADVVCLVRAKDAGDGFNRLQRTLAGHGLWKDTFAARVKPLVGDFTLPHLGLDNATLDALAGNLDAIYHNGAQVNFVLPYEDLKAANVDSTVDLLKLAVAGKDKPLHFVSSLALFCTPENAGKRVQESDEQPAREVALLNGYAQSKWVAEQLLRQARSRGVQASIYRPVFIGWHSVNGSHNPSDFICGMIAACLRLGAAPRIESAVHITPVDYVSQAIIHLSLQAGVQGRDFNLVPPALVSFDEVARQLAVLAGPIVRMESGAWQGQLRRAGGEVERDDKLWLLSTLMEESFGAGSIFESMAHLTEVDSRNVTEGLAGSSIVCPPLDRALLAPFVNALGHPLRERRAPRRHETLADNEAKMRP